MKRVIDKIISQTFFRFLMVGGTSTLIDFVAYMLISIKLPIVYSKLISMVVSSVYAYFANKIFTFKNSEKSSIGYFIRYYIVFGANMITNVAVNTLLFQTLGYKIVAFLAATCAGMLVNYLGQKFFVFRNGSGEK